MRYLYLVTLLGFFAFLSSLRQLWEMLNKNNPDLTVEAFIGLYVAKPIGGAFLYMLLPIIVLVFKGRSFDRYFICALVTGPILLYFAFIGTNSG